MTAYVQTVGTLRPTFVNLLYSVQTAWHVCWQVDEYNGLLPLLVWTLAACKFAASRSAMCACHEACTDVALVCVLLNTNARTGG